MTKRKVLLMGKSGSGKTSMRSIIFANYVPRDVNKLGPTLGVENSHVKFLGNLVLNLWDCGGQDVFMENYFESQRDQIFRNVEVLIYVFDVDSHEREKDVDYFRSCIDAIRANSKGAHVFCLIHKMDLVHGAENKQRVFEERCAELEEVAKDIKISCFRTSIWDETLYKAWSAIVYSLVPNIKQLEAQLGKFAALCEADEVVLFEKATFLVISNATLRDHADPHRFEKISNIVKQFKLSCTKAQSQFQSMQMRSQSHLALIDSFTSNTYIMVVVSNPRLLPAALSFNIDVARTHFDKFIVKSMGL
jgi:Ras-related GTP-binding protein A/B